MGSSISPQRQAQPDTEDNPATAIATADPVVRRMDFEDDGAPLDMQEDDWPWTCDHCGNQNEAHQQTCEHCGKLGDEENEGDGMETETADVAGPASSPQPARQKRQRRVFVTPPKSKKAENNPYSEQAWKRLNACIMISVGGMKKGKACEKAGINHSRFTSNGWLRQYEAHGPLHVLTADNRSKKQKIGTPETRKFIKEKSKGRGGRKKDKSARAVRDQLKQHYEDTEQEDRELPSLSYIRQIAHEEAGPWLRNPHAPLFLVRTPWDARWRKCDTYRRFSIIFAIKSDLTIDVVTPMQHML